MLTIAIIVIKEHYARAVMMQIYVTLMYKQLLFYWLKNNNLNMAHYNY